MNEIDLHFPEWSGEDLPPPRPKRPHKGNIKGNKLHPQPITKEEAERLIAACGDERIVSKRNKAIVAVLYRGMLRCCEAVHLKRADVNLATGEIRVLFGKGRKARTIALDARSLGYVADWIKEREDVLDLWGGVLFCQLGREPGKAMVTWHLRRLMPKLARRAGIEKRVHPHGLRHSGACELRKAGVDIGIISRALGHETISTTARYLDHIAPVDVTNAMRKMEW